MITKHDGKSQPSDSSVVIKRDHFLNQNFYWPWACRRPADVGSGSIWHCTNPDPDKRFLDWQLPLTAYLADAFVQISTHTHTHTEAYFGISKQRELSSTADPFIARYWIVVLHFICKFCQRAQMSQISIVFYMFDIFGKFLIVLVKQFAEFKFTARSV